MKEALDLSSDRILNDDLKERRGYSHLKAEALNCTMWRNRFGGDFEPVVRQNTEWMNVIIVNSEQSESHFTYGSKFISIRNLQVYYPICS